EGAMPAVGSSISRTFGAWARAMASSERLALMALTADIIAKEGVSVLFTEHDMDVVFAHAHRILVLNRGALIAEGTGEAIRANPLVQEVYLGGGTVFAEGHA
ncbi:MAG: hypothetical protein AAGF49_08405, partial [Pseudomonadota bacterium]